MESLPYMFMLCFLGFALLTFALLAVFIAGAALHMTRKAHNEDADPEEQQSLDLPRQLMLSGGVSFLMVVFCLLTMILGLRPGR